MGKRLVGTMKSKELSETSRQLCRNALFAGETDRVAPGMDHFWILHTLDSAPLHGALRRQMFVEWLELYITRIN